MQIARVHPYVTNAVLGEPRSTGGSAEALRVEKDVYASPPSTKPSKRDREIMEEVAKTGRFLAPGILDPYSVLKAEENVALRHASGRKQRRRIEKAFDAKEDELAKRVPRDMVGRLGWAKDQLKKQVTDQKAAVGAVEDKIEKLRERISKLEETDGRTAEEKSANEPPHPPHRKIEELKQKLEALREELGVEKKILRELERELPGKLHDLEARIDEEKKRGRVWKWLKKRVFGD